MALFFLAGGTTPARAATFVVTNLNNSGVGSLRQAIVSANSTTGADTITFSVSGTITLSSELPLINDPSGLTINGTGQTVIINGNHNVRVATVVGSSLTLDNLTIANGYGSVNGGGGITVAPAATLIIKNSTFTGNTGGSYYGGGIYIGRDSFNPPGMVNISNSTFSGNSAIRGGAIYNEGTLTITNSTFSDNTAARGGAIETYGGTVDISSSTFSGNLATELWVYGGSIEETASSVTLRNTIVANNPLGNVCGGVFNNDGNNLSDDTSCGWGSDSGSKSSTDPLLGLLANNGGPTSTISLLPGSPAFNAGNNATCPDADQRGISRPQGTRCDIGAFERVHFPFFLPSVLR